MAVRKYFIAGKYSSRHQKGRLSFIITSNTRITTMEEVTDLARKAIIDQTVGSIENIQIDITAFNNIE